MVSSESMEEDGPSDVDHFKDVSVQSLMKLYYGTIFPFKELANWLAYGNDGKHAQADGSFLQRREICYTLFSDIFVRYQSFKNAEEMQREIRREVPAKIDIGPVYSCDPKRRNANKEGSLGLGFVPMERELVFDIDATDYDDVRTCCQGADICTKCWPLMAIAVEVLEAALTKDFGFKCILWVFSGRRGIHAWVCDNKSRKLTDEMRGALSRYLTVYKGVEDGRVKIDIPANGILHPSVERAVKIIKDAWVETILPEQDLLGEQNRWQRVLQPFEGQEFVQRLDARWRSRPSDSVSRWEELLAEVGKVSKQRGMAIPMKRAMNEVYLAHAYPRLDVEVTKKMNHLLKAPFCVHPKTGKVCVPMDATEIWLFNPAEVPTVQSVLRELGLKPDSFISSSVNPSRAEETSLVGCMRVFQSFIRSLVVDSHKALNENGKQKGPGLAW